MAEIGMGRSGEAVDAAVLAAAIGVDRLREADVRAVVGGDDALGALRAHMRLEGVERAKRLPSVVERLGLLAIVSAGPVGTCATTASPLRVDGRPQARR